VIDSLLSDPRGVGVAEASGLKTDNNHKSPRLGAATPRGSITFAINSHHANSG